METTTERPLFFTPREFARAFRPAGDHLLIEPLEGARHTESGLELPASVGKNPYGRVLAAGPDSRYEAGQDVIYRPAGATEINADAPGLRMLILRDGNVMGHLDYQAATKKAVAQA